MEINEDHRKNASFYQWGPFFSQVNFILVFYTKNHEGNTKNREEDEETGFNLKPGSLSKQIIGADIEIHRLPVMCLLKSPFKVFMIYNREKWNRELNVKNFNLRERNWHEGCIIAMNH